MLISYTRSKYQLWNAVFVSDLATENNLFVSKLFSVFKMVWFVSKFFFYEGIASKLSLFVTTIIFIWF